MLGISGMQVVLLAVIFHATYLLLDVIHHFLVTFDGG